jgi:DNA-directed RNA polymerase subunit RPC12/RpoP
LLDVPAGRDRGGNVLVVSTECPTCGAPLDFDEGSNAVRCDHCASNLLVTGRGQVLSYVVAATLGGAEARSLARFALGDAGQSSYLATPRLCLVPYYRLTATELRWQHARDEDERERRERERERKRLFDSLDLPLVVSELFAGGSFGTGSSARPGRSRKLEFVGRRLERNLLACPSVPASPSLGVRPSVLRLELFRRDTLPRDAIVARCEVDAAAALRAALVATGEAEVVAREVVGRVLSVLYYPLWTAVADSALGRRVVLIDAVSGAVVDGAAPGDVLGRLGSREPGGDPPVAGFRPLACPNCGWNLPVHPADVVFHCHGCERDWLVEGDRLLRQESAVVEAPGGARADVDHHRPFWSVPREDTESEGRCLVPAFRHANMRLLNELAVRLSRKGVPESGEGGGREMRGCAIDAADAVAMARFLAAGRTPNGKPLLDEALGAGSGFTTAGARLLWLPFLRDAYGWREPLTGTALPPEMAA